MKYAAALAFLPLVLAAACSGNGAGGGSDAAPAASVASVAPPAGQSWTEVVSETPEGGFRMGNPNAPIKLVEYGDRLCPGCKAFATTGYEPLKKYVESGKVSFEFRDFLIHGAPALALAALGQCAGPQPFFPILEQNYALQDGFNEKAMATPADQQQALQGKAPGEVATFWANQLGAIDFVKQRGIPDAQARACLADTKRLDKIVAITTKAGEEGTVTGTPTLIVNGTKVDGIGWSDVEKALRAQGA